MRRGTTAFRRSPVSIPHNIPHCPFMAGFQTQSDLSAKSPTRRKLVFQQNRPTAVHDLAEMRAAKPPFLIENDRSSSGDLNAGLIDGFLVNRFGIVCRATKTYHWEQEHAAARLLRPKGRNPPSGAHGRGDIRATFVGRVSRWAGRKARRHMANRSLHRHGRAREGDLPLRRES